ncbi:hypothetical protein ACTG2S_08260 [Aeromonas sp. 82P]|uniref:hypothetical protein n=1 Tax=Aeromonas sp. 82P TaxID=3452726 RepID=UPI003F7B0906
MLPKEALSYSVTLLCFPALSALYFLLLSIGDEEAFFWNLKQFLLVSVNLLLFLFLLTTFFIRMPYIIHPIILARAFSYFLLLSIILCGLQLSIDEFKRYYIENFTALEGHWYDFAITSFRGIGWQGLSIWDTSLSYAIISWVLYPMLFSVRVVDKITWFVGMICLFVLVCISGRTGLFAFVMIFFLQLYLSAKYINGFLVVFTLIAIIALLFIFGGEQVQYLISFSFEVIGNFISGRGIQSESTNDLVQNHLYVPVLKNILLGENYYINQPDLSFLNNINKPSDSSLVINYVFFGIIGLVLTFLLIFFNSKILLKAVHDITGFHSRTKEFVLVLSIFLLIFFVYVKAPPYYSQTYIKTVSFLLFFGRACHIEQHYKYKQGGLHGAN